MFSRLRSWLHGIPAAIAVIGGIASIIFSLVYVFVTLYSFNRKLPTAQVLSEGGQTCPGKQVHIFGEYLDGVENILLIGNGGSHRVPFFLVSDSQLVLTIHNQIPTGDYHLGFTKKGHATISTQRKLSIRPCTISPLLTDKNHIRPPIIFANLNWEISKLQTAIARFIVEHGYGYQTGIIPSTLGAADLNFLDMWQGLLKGTIHVVMEVWLPQQQAIWDHALLEGTVIPLGASLTEQWQSAFVVPTYMIKGEPWRWIEPRAPSLKHVADLRKYKDLFATSTSRQKAVLWNCPKSWSCSKFTRAQVEAYGLQDIIEVYDPSSVEELFRSLQEAYAKGDPWLGFMWGPSTRTASEMQLTPLEELPHGIDCWKQKSCGYGPSHVMIAAHPSLIDLAPDVVHLLRKWDFNEMAMAGAFESLKATGQFEDAAQLFFAKL